MWYELRDDEINWKRGVWFRTTGIVPYNRITNLDVRQGPFMRYLGISTLAIQTAGYSGRPWRQRFGSRLSSMQKSSGR
jgi:membrane protein YdbS with pleckstrin-like domain